MQCPNCGMEITDINIKNCPKCSQNMYGFFKDELLVIDIAHHGEDWFDAEQKILDGINLAIKEKYKGLKVVHGRGKDEGHTNIIKQNAIPFLVKLAKQYNCKLIQDSHTDGAHILYFNK